MAKNALKIFLQAVFVILLIVLAVWFSRVVGSSEVVASAISRFGYLGIFFVSVLSGFNLVVPIPAIAFLPVFLAAGLNFWLTIAVVTLGMTTGDSVGFLLGDTGRKLVKGRYNSRVNVLLERFRSKHALWPYVVLFLYASFAPVPNELMVIPMSFAGYRLRYVFPIVFAGNFLFNTLAAFGVIQLFGLL